MPFKPMLAAKCEDIKSIRFPVLASAKLDGIRALVINGQLVSRQLKPIPNRYLQEKFSKLPEGTDGELIFGDPTHKDAYRNTVSAVMTEDGEPEEVCFHVFDNFLSPGGFAQRYRVVEHTNDYVGGVICVPHMPMDTVQQLEEFEAQMLEAGYEGVMVRSLNGPYKQNRSTEKEGFLLKVKRFEDGEAVVIGYYERMHNANEATTDLLGHTARSSHKENLVGHGDLGGLDVRGISAPYNGVEFSIGTGFDAETRKKFWPLRQALVGQIVKYKFFPSGSKDRPRFPVFLGMRHSIDL